MRRSDKQAEVSDEITDRNLPAKLKAFELLLAQRRPEFALCIGGLLA
jgi:hypothetical protein